MLVIQVKYKELSGSVYDVLTLTMCLWKDLVTEGRLFFLVKMAGPPSFDASYELHVKTYYL